MQTVISVNDPSFDLSAIVEVNENSDVLSQQSDKPEIKFDSSMELDNFQDETAPVPANSSAIWYVYLILTLFVTSDSNYYFFISFLTGHVSF